MDKMVSCIEILGLGMLAVYWLLVLVNAITFEDNMSRYLFSASMTALASVLIVCPPIFRYRLQHDFSSFPYETNQSELPPPATEQVLGFTIPNAVHELNAPNPPLPHQGLSADQRQKISEIGERLKKSRQLESKNAPAEPENVRIDEMVETFRDVQRGRK
jgi:hypothetical protein